MAQKLVIFLVGILIGIAILQPSRTASIGSAAASPGALEPSAQHPEHVQGMLPPMGMQKNSRSKRYADGEERQDVSTVPTADNTTKGRALALHENTINSFIRFILVLLTVTPTFM